jgi:hypothetical protein
LPFFIFLSISNFSAPDQGFIESPGPRCAFAPGNVREREKRRHPEGAPRQSYSSRQRERDRRSSEWQDPADLPVSPPHRPTPSSHSELLRRRARLRLSPTPPRRRSVTGPAQPVPTRSVTLPVPPPSPRSPLRSMPPPTRPRKRSTVACTREGSSPR